MKDIEQRGAFYLGRRYELDRAEIGDEPLLYEAEDLTTHAVCVGMTGSGKTGLGVSLLEEAALEGVPALVIDPKGDMGNLMLTFPELRPEDFRPWVDPGEAARRGLELDAYAASVAQTWREGLARWGQDGARIARLRDAAEAVIYTPGSTAGRPLTVLRTFDAPPPAVANDVEALGERVQSSVAGLLALLGIDADPVQSRESILLANLLQQAWGQGRGVDLAELIRGIQAPPFERLGVLDLETFFPAKDRARLAMTLNGLLASPGFARWLEGDPLDVGKLLQGPDGRPRIAILSIAHLSDAERMFFVTILLNEVVTWMRSQTGTSGLRALLYMDEIFGYFPPTREPPSKRPMLTLLKQARAYGLGVVLATQNPVDLDYKGLANAGTWFIGRLQTERDKARVLDGLEGVLADGPGGAMDRSELDRVLSRLGKRVFLVKNVHEREPIVFHTRWALSYLRGPLGREHLQALAAPATAPPTPASPAPAQEEAPSDAARPILPPGVEEAFAAAPEADGTLLYRPTLATTGRLHFASARHGVDTWRTISIQAELAEREPCVSWERARIDSEPPARRELQERPGPGARFAPLPADAGNAKRWKSWAKELQGFLYRNRTLALLRCKAYRLISEPSETEADFRARVADAAQERGRAELDKLRTRFASKLGRLRERLRKARQRLDEQEDQFKRQRRSSWMAAGSSILATVLGRKRRGSTARAFDRASKEKEDMRRAEDDVEARERDLTLAERELEREEQELAARHRVEEIEIEEVPIRPRKSDIALEPLTLVWRPERADAG